MSEHPFLTRVTASSKVVDIAKTLKTKDPKELEGKMKVCGPKLSLCGLVLSVWGIIQLTLMGVFYYIKAVALLEDLPMEEGSHHSIEDFVAQIEAGYQLNAYNCWIAALLYVITLALSAHQFWMNNRSSVSM